MGEGDKTHPTWGFLIAICAAFAALGVAIFAAALTGAFR